jgi:glycosyltransferase involved in cell wall biosynthesis
MKKVLFVFDHKYEGIWRDGLWAALELLADEYELVKWNLHWQEKPSLEGIEFILGWGAFESKVDRTLRLLDTTTPKGLCIAGVAMQPYKLRDYKVLFYETEWYKDNNPEIAQHRGAIHAFGVNTNIYNRQYAENVFPKIWDYVSVGAFALWKRQSLLLEKVGNRLAIGEIQKENLDESMGIVAPLLLDGVAISDMVAPEVLANIYRCAKTVFIPADLNGGGERAVLEAKACGIPVEVMPDNPKLLELANSVVDYKSLDEHYYAQQLSRGIEYATTK